MARALRTSPSEARGLAPYSRRPTSLGRPCAAGIARRQDQSDRVVDRCLVDRNALGGDLQLDHVGSIEQPGRLRRLVGHPGHDRPFLGGSRVVDRDPHQESITLGLGERIDPL